MALPLMTEATESFFFRWRGSARTGPNRPAGHRLPLQRGEPSPHRGPGGVPQRLGCSYE